MNISLKPIEVPPCDGGAPSPVVLADDNTVVFGYYEATDSPFDRGVVIKVPSCSIFKFGAPNDEALSGHRYAQFGLDCYSAYEVMNSEWTRELMVANRVHPQHDDSLFASHRHFIFTFHDTTLEFVTQQDFEVTKVVGSPKPHLMGALED